MSFCRAPGTLTPPWAVRAVRASFSGSPAVVRPPPSGDFLLAHSVKEVGCVLLECRQRAELLDVDSEEVVSRGMGFFLPVARSMPHTSSPKGPDWNAVLSSSTVSAQLYPL